MTEGETLGTRLQKFLLELKNDNDCTIAIIEAKTGYCLR
jgi:hypothetical protein